MRAFAVVALALLVFSSPLSAQTTITDSGGRQVTLPATIKKIFPAGPPASVLLYTLAPETMLGWSRDLTAEQKRFLPLPYGALPTLGRLTGKGDTINTEAVLNLSPDLIFDTGTVNQTYISLADRVQERLSIPYILLDGSFSKLPETYRVLGRIIGKEREGEKLARAVEAIVSEAKAAAAASADSRPPRIFIARGANGLQTGVSGPQDLLTILHATNAVPNTGNGGMVNVSAEELIAWDPDFILAADAKFMAKMASDPVWSNLTAVQKGRVYRIPDLPFDWLDVPPGVNRLIGLQWLASLLYPEHAASDIRERTRQFYKTFYHLDLSEGDLDTVLANSVPAKAK